MFDMQKHPGTAYLLNLSNNSLNSHQNFSFSSIFSELNIREVNWKFHAKKYQYKRKNWPWGSTQCHSDHLDVVSIKYEQYEGSAFTCGKP